MDTAVAAIRVDSASVATAISWTSTIDLSCGTGASGGLCGDPGAACLDIVGLSKSVFPNRISGVRRRLRYEIASDTWRGFDRTVARPVMNEGDLVNMVSKALTRA